LRPPTVIRQAPDCKIDPLILADLLKTTLKKRHVCWRAAAAKPTGTYSWH